MLHAIGFPDAQMPQLLVHGWWNLGGAKMSKSTGNIIDPFVLIDKYGADALRYYLMSDIAPGSDADFDLERLVARYNGDLANSLGNLLNRSLTMVQRYRSGRIQRGAEDTVFEKNGSHASLPQFRNDFVIAWARAYPIKMKALAVQLTLHETIHVARSADFLIDIAAPWELARDETRSLQLDAVLYHVIESLRIVAILISPILPRAAHGIFDQLNWKMELSGKEERFSLKDAEWGRLPDGHVVGKPVPLFPRIEG
jgi:methionyl-tRNA synthetase